MELTTRLQFKEKATKYNNLIEAGKRRLKKYPLWKRLFYYTKFNGIRERIKGYEDMRFFLVMMMLRRK